MRPRPLVGFDCQFGVPDRLDSAIELTPFLQQHCALSAHCIHQRNGFPIEQRPDLLQRNANEAQRDNLLQAFQIPLDVGAITRLGPRRLQQTQPVIMMQRTYGDAGQFSELVYPIHLHHLQA